MDDQQIPTLQYFGYGTNRDHDMMAAMIGREELQGEPGRLLDHELGVQALKDIPDTVADRAPEPRSPREIVERAFGASFEVYITRPSPGSVTCGTIWHITADELKLVHEWELLEFGMQEEMKAVAINSKGETIEVDTHGLLDPQIHVDRVVSGDDYIDYLVPKDDILRVAHEVRLEYLKRNGRSGLDSPAGS